LAVCNHAETHDEHSPGRDVHNRMDARVDASLHLDTNLLFDFKNGMNFTPISPVR
jgi:hypothetical protein